MMRRGLLLAVLAVLFDPVAVSAADIQQLHYRVIALEAKVREMSVARPPATDGLGQRVRTLELQVAALQQAIARLHEQLAGEARGAPR